MRREMLPFSPPAIGEAEIDEVVAALRSGWITTGPRVQTFEREFASYLGAGGAHAVSSCTDAMQIALAAMRVGPGDAVFVPTHTFAATAHVVDHRGAVPVLVDVEPDTLNLDPRALEAAIAAVRAEGGLRPRAVMPVHFAGHPVDLEAITAIAESEGLAIVEDAAHALPASYRGVPIGRVDDSSIPRAVAFSFYATKNLTTGEGGMLTATPEVLDESRLWSLHGMSRDAWQRYDKRGAWRYDVVRPGYKANMTDPAAAMGLVQLRRLDDMQRRRRQIVDAYDRAFTDHPALEVPTRRPDVESALHLYPLRLRLELLSIDRDRFIVELADRNISASVHFIPLHLMSHYRDTFTLRAQDFPVASREFPRLVSLPLHPRLTPTDVDDVIEAVLDVVSEFRR